MRLLRKLIAENLIDNEAASVALYDWRTWWARENQLAPEKSQTGGAWHVWLALAGRGFGKMLAIETPLPTPSGWTTMGEVRVGDSVFDEAGKACRVTALHPIKMAAEAYRVTFSDGSYIDACAEHLWTTWTHAERKAFLRSPYEDPTRFPENWPAWRLKRQLGTDGIGEIVVNEALRLAANWDSARSISRQLGVSRATLAPHLRAGRYLPRSPVIHDDAPGPQVRTTRDLAATLTYGSRGDLNHCIPHAAPLELPEADLPVPPYALGYWLGDGSTGVGDITAHQNDHAHIIAQFASEGINARPAASDPQRLLTSLPPLLRRAFVLSSKQVPRAYLRASIAQRLALLQGLMDSDGGVELASTVSFTNTNKQIADALYELVVSLGMRATRDDRIPTNTTTGKQGQRAYRITFTPTMDVFRLPRKRERVSFDVAQRLRRRHRMIVSVERIESVRMRCITVDSPNSLYLAGASMIPTHNTRSGAEWFNEQAAIPGLESLPMAIVGRTAADVRDVLVEGPAGILACAPPWDRPLYEPSKRRLTWKNGATATTFSAEEPDSLRGPQFRCALADEIAAWSHFDDAWSNLLMGTRLGDHPRIAALTTPRPLKMIRELLDDPDVAITRGRTMDNAANLSRKAVDYLLKKFEGTRLGRQELEGVYLEDLPGALWTQEMLATARTNFRAWGRPYERDAFERIVVAVDPSGSDGAGADEGDAQGIVVAGKFKKRDDKGRARFVLLEDCTGQRRPEEWAAETNRLAEKWAADSIIAEKNYGGAMVRATLAQAKPFAPVRLVNASKGKTQRAEPISALYEQGRVAHAHDAPDPTVDAEERERRSVEAATSARGFAEMEEEMTQFTGSGFVGKRSPNRADAGIWALTALAVPVAEPGIRSL